jgi:hypothetical protein
VEARGEEHGDGRAEGCRGDRGRSAQAVGHDRGAGCPGSAAGHWFVLDHHGRLPGDAAVLLAVAEAGVGRRRCRRGRAAAGSAAARRGGAGTGRAREAVGSGAGARCGAWTQDRRDRRARGGDGRAAQPEPAPRAQPGRGGSVASVEPRRGRPGLAEKLGGCVDLEPPVRTSTGGRLLGSGSRRR